MTEQVRDLSTELPMSAEGIAEIVAAGGQAGIARDELMQFATDAVKMAWPLIPRLKSPADDGPVAYCV
ncbi:phage tail tape measure protein [Escherichia coli]|uniref:phage tail tape measure protein n=1 Tax=Escherichia coli TaxID=562 RepID=UPI002074E55A|nr:phage tail tape measure protein [Escherichia coli]